MGKKASNFVQERIAKERARQALKRGAWRHNKVYGRQGKSAPAYGPSTSVRTVGGGFETSRRHH